MKRWEVANLPASQRALVNSWPGVTLVDTVPEVRAPMKRREPSKPIEDWFEEILKNDEDAPLRDRGSTTNMHGDDPSWFNYFADQNPISFFGFSSLSKLVQFTEQLPISYRNDRNSRGDAWERNSGVWAGTPDMDAAVKMARDGWPKGVDMAQEIVEHLTGDNAMQNRRKHGVAGGSVNVGRMLSGNPMHMRSRPKQPGKKIITFFVEGIMSAAIRADDAIIRAAVVAAMVDVLEMNGFSCEIVSICNARHGNRSAYQVATAVKAAGEPLNINDVIFALGHPSYLRRLVFATAAADEDLRDVWSSMGMPTHSFTSWHPVKSNELYVQMLQYEHRNRITGKDLTTKAIQMWDLIVKGKMPIEINREDD